MSDDYKTSASPVFDYGAWADDNDIEGLRAHNDKDDLNKLLKGLKTPGGSASSSTSSSRSSSSASSRSSSSASSRSSSPQRMFRRPFDISGQATSDNYMPRANSIIPQGRSILASGGGLINAPVQYTNSRSFKNSYKDVGSLSSS